MHYGSQEDVAFLKTIKNKRGYFDVIIDDGGHTMSQQITSITHLLPKMRSGGLYVIEDLETSYMPTYKGSGAFGNISTIEFIKKLIDDLQRNSPTRKRAVLGKRISSFEIASGICVFNVL